MVFENEPANEDFEGFCVTKENKMISSTITYFQKFVSGKCTSVRGS
jgi:hypothetical protein